MLKAYNKSRKSITSFIPLILISWSSHCFSKNLITRQDIENIAQKANISEIEECKNLSYSVCYTVLGGGYYWGTKFKDKKVEDDDIIAQDYLKKTLISSPIAREIFGYIIEKSRPKESYVLLLSAANEGLTSAIYELGHTSQVYTDKDILERIKWRKILLEKDPSSSKYEYAFIGNFYLRLSTPDYSNALYWLNKAIEQEDDMDAEFDIAGLYAEGKGVAQDYVTAYMYYDLAGSAGAENKAKLVRAMTPTQLREGISRSHLWQDERHTYRPGYGAWNNMGGIEWNAH